jgi:RimJ/RimL family protein N-acetyltransferase
MAFPDAFATDRLRAERLRPDHLRALRQMDTDPQFTALLGGVRDEKRTAAYLERNLQHWTRYNFGVWMLFDAASNRLAGRALLRHLVLDASDDVEVGYGFLPAFWGRGLATEIATACVGFGFDELGLSSIVAITLPENLKSRRVLAKAGLVYERDVRHEGLRHLFFRVLRPEPGIPASGR